VFFTTTAAAPGLASPMSGAGAEATSVNRLGCPAIAVGSAPACTKESVVTYTASPAE
jgi:hypothetical protein